jgi:AraC-like DNA-binding protein
VSRVSTAPQPDFASAAMLRTLVVGLRQQGITLPPPSAMSAHVPLQHKRALLDAIWQRHGPEVLLNVGQALPHMDSEPTALALTLARDAFDLLQRWQRLERFVHSRHRVECVARTEHSMVLRHVSLAPAHPPTVAEDLLVWGVLTALFERIGNAALRCRLPGESAWRRVNQQWLGAGWPAQVGTWEIQWEPALALASPKPAAAPVAESADQHQTAKAALARDPARAWTVAALAAEVNTSPRTLQRRLAQEQSSFGELLAAARAAQAAQWLATSALSPAEIGYVCGYSDQAHFTRQFKRQVALTPRVYRQQFGAARA